VGEDECVGVFELLRAGLLGLAGLEVPETLEASGGREGGRREGERIRMSVDYRSPLKREKRRSRRMGKATARDHRR